MSDDTSSTASVTIWIQGIMEGDQESAELLWKRYFNRLMTATSKKLVGKHRRISDEEDIVLDTFDALFQQAKMGKFPKLHDRTDLWKLLLTIADCKLKNKIRSENALVRGGGHVIKGDSIFLNADPDSAKGFEQFANQDPTPDFCLSMKESCGQLLDQLDHSLQQVAVLKLRNYKNPEIAEEVGCSVATVERRARKIRDIWSEYLQRQHDRKEPNS